MSSKNVLGLFDPQVLPFFGQVGAWWGLDAEWYFLQYTIAAQKAIMRTLQGLTTCLGL